MRVTTLFLVLIGSALAQPDAQKAGVTVQSLLSGSVESFDVSDAIFRDGMSELSLKKIPGLHLGFEDVVRERIQDDPRAESPHFSLHLSNVSVRQILDQLCASDPRYTWSLDGDTINVYPRTASTGDSYLPNLWIDWITVTSIANPDQALVPLSKLFPKEDIGYMGPGLGDNSYSAPWTSTFGHLTVRQFINRVAEHMGPRTAWIWRGGKNEMLFTFVKDGFHTR
jgi:hypothetical protein